MASLVLVIALLSAFLTFSSGNTVDHLNDSAHGETFHLNNGSRRLLIQGTDLDSVRLPVTYRVYYDVTNHMNSFPVSQNSTGVTVPPRRHRVRIRVTGNVRTKFASVVVYDGKYPNVFRLGSINSHSCLPLEVVATQSILTIQLHVQSGSNKEFDLQVEIGAPLAAASTPRPAPCSTRRTTIWPWSSGRYVTRAPVRTTTTWRDFLAWINDRSTTRSPFRFDGDDTWNRITVPSWSPYEPDLDPYDSNDDSYSGGSSMTTTVGASTGGIFFLICIIIGVRLGCRTRRVTTVVSRPRGTITVITRRRLLCVPRTPATPVEPPPYDSAALINEESSSNSNTDGKSMGAPPPAYESLSGSAATSTPPAQPSASAQTQVTPTGRGPSEAPPPTYSSSSPPAVHGGANVAVRGQAYGY